MYNILVLEPEYFDKEIIDLLRKAGKVRAKRLSRKQLEEAIPEVDVLIVRIEEHIDKDLLSVAKRLKIIGSVTTGLDHIDVEYAKGMGIKIINLHGLHTASTAEYTIGLMLSLLRRIPWSYKSLSRGVWKRYQFIGSILEGKTLGVVGLGRIGSRVATYARAFGMNVIYFDPYVDSSPIARRVTLEELLRESDIVTVHAALTSGSKGELGYEEMKTMKKSAFLINTSRGAVVSEDALLEALKNKVIAGAAIDVFVNEPLTDKDNQLLAYARKHSNLLVTPHVAASTRESAHDASLEVAAAVIKELNSMR
ncbi:MAG: hydroxyacid dehydrogenase [Candidatus Micrarchaeota archaeon]|nr:hydroxyacid dehydrogenase [Candidatus Micrarchaeota archaeon]